MKTSISRIFGLAMLPVFFGCAAQESPPDGNRSLSPSPGASAVQPAPALPRPVGPQPPAIAPPSVVPPTVPRAGPSPPAAVNSCDAGGCTDTGGNRYGGGTGNVYLDRQGRTCLRNGNWLQCN